MKRLLCIISVMNTGGAETFLMKIYRKLDRTKYQMDFCVNSTSKGYYDEEIKSLGGKIYFIPCKSQGLLKFKKNLSNLLESNRYDYVLRITSNDFGFYDLKIAKKCGVKCTIARSSNSSDGSSLSKLIVHYFGRFLFSDYVDIKIAPSDLAAKYTFGNKLYKSNQVHILHNGLDMDVFEYNEKMRKKKREELNINNDTFVIGHIGRLTKQKNHLFLLDVFEKINTSLPNSVLILVGDGELKQEIINKAKDKLLLDKILFLGIRSDIPDLLSTFDLFLFPSFYEGMPNTVIEAQANGLPCLLSDSITKEVNITGLVYFESLKSSPDKWANRAIQICENVERKNTRESFIEKEYNIDSVVKNFVKIIFEGERL